MDAGICFRPFNVQTILQCGMQNFYKVTDFIEILLSYQTEDKGDGMYTYDINSDGQIQIADWGKPLRYYGVEWYGNGKGKEYYQKMKEFFDAEKTGAGWKQK